MSNVIINDNHLKDIADTIRSKNETSNKYKPSEMAGAINEFTREDYYIDASLSPETNANYLLNRLIVRIPPIETSHRSDFSYAFQRCNNLVELQELDAGNATNLTNIFASCTSLVKFGGLKDVGKSFLPTASASYSYYTFNLNNTNLNRESALNVLNKAYDIASLGVKTQNIILGDAISLVTPEEIAIATAKGWSVA